MAQVVQIMRDLVLTYLAGWKHWTSLPTCLNLGRWRGWPFDLVQPVSTWREKDRKRRHAHTDFNFRHFSVFAISCSKKRLPTHGFVCAAGCAWYPLGGGTGRPKHPCDHLAALRGTATWWDCVAEYVPHWATPCYALPCCSCCSGSGVGGSCPCRYSWRFDGWVAGGGPCRESRRFLYIYGSVGANWSGASRVGGSLAPDCDSCSGIYSATTSRHYSPLLWEWAYKIVFCSTDYGSNCPSL